MQEREKKLAMAVGGLAATLAAWFLFDSVTGGFSSRGGQVATLEKQVKANEATLREFQKQQQKLAELKRVSLPIDRELARNLYSSWLMKQGTQAGLTGMVVSPGANQGVQGNFERNTFTLEATGTLESVVKFLFGFYQGDHLHKIHTLSVKPNDKGKNFVLQVAVETLSLIGENKKQSLNASISPRLAEKDFEKYKAAIMGRNLFAAYVPPPPPKVEPKITRVETPAPRPPDPPPPPFDHARFAFITSFLSSKTGAEAWMYVRTKGPDKIALREGDTFEVGTVKGQVTRIGSDFLEFTSNGRTKRVTKGTSLRDATEETSTKSVE